jgi:hypothetical protein
MRVKRQRLVAPDPGAAGPSNRGREEDPTYVPPRRLRGWECVLVALHGTEGETLSIADVRSLAAPILAMNGVEFGHNESIRVLKEKGYIENVPRVIKLTPAGKLACDEVVARG